MAVRFIIDSASDILPAEAKELGMVHIPMEVNFDGEIYHDSVDITHREFYEKLIESDVLPKTSQISPAAFDAAIRPLVENGDEVMVFTMSSELSGTYQSACLAASNYPGKAYVVDTLNATVGERIVIFQALEYAKQGMKAEQIAEQIDKDKYKVRLLAVLDTLEYLKKGGRISASVAILGNMLSIKPVVTVKDGKVEMAGKARGSKNGSNLLRKMALEGNGIDYDRPLAIGYSGMSDAMLTKYVEDNADLWRPQGLELPFRTVGATIGTHVGPGAIAVAFFEKD